MHTMKGEHIERDTLHVKDAREDDEEENDRRKEGSKL